MSRVEIKRQLSEWRAERDKRLADMEANRAAVRGLDKLIAAAEVMLGERDDGRVSNAARIRVVLKPGEWYTLADIVRMTALRPSEASAAVHGMTARGHIARRGARRSYEYRLR